MPVTPLPFLDRTAATFKTDTDTFFGSQLPQFSVEVNQVAGAADASAAAALASKNAAATSATNAANSATAANTSRTNAANSATSAGTSATNAADSATASAGSAAAANTSKNASATSAASALSEANRAKAAADSIASGPVTSVNGKTGVVALVKADVGLGSVDNVSVVAAGIGTPDLMSDTPNIDDFTLRNGWYSVGPSSLGVKPVGPTRGTVIVSGRSFTAIESRAAQLYFAEGLDLLPWVFARNSYKGVWTAWVEVTLPSVSGLARKPLTTGEASATAREWSDTLSISKYIDKMIAATATASHALNLALATVFDLTLSVNTTFTISNMPSLSGESLTLVIRVRQAAAPKTITWFSGITWLTPGGLVPAVPAASQIVEYILSTTGTGTTWVGRVGAST